MQLCMADEFNNQLTKVRYILIVFLNSNPKHRIPKKNYGAYLFLSKMHYIKNLCIMLDMQDLRRLKYGITFGQGFCKIQLTHSKLLEP